MRAWNMHVKRQIDDAILCNCASPVSSLLFSHIVIPLVALLTQQFHSSPVTVYMTIAQLIND